MGVNLYIYILMLIADCTEISSGVVVLEPLGLVLLSLSKCRMLLLKALLPLWVKRNYLRHYRPRVGANSRRCNIPLEEFWI